ncbi:MAG TPA: beta-ketoacyl-ACP synthase III [Acidimicrobiales bacterium]|nr:beta-ketoacyl-ACP synthase III [Acidimicrobiales bacterium]
MSGAGTNVPVAIAGFGTYAPERVMTNADFEKILDTNDAWITERTGIKERHFVADDECTSTMAIAAAADAIKDAGLTPDDIDLLVMATTTPDQMVPAASAFVSDGLGLRCGSFDVNAACAGFAYGLVVGSSMISTGHRNVLVIGAETISRFLNFEDRGTAIIFGDGAGAAVLTPSTDGAGLLGWDLGCDGSAARLIEVPVGGSRRPAAPDTVTGTDHYLQMQGNEVFRKAVRAVEQSALAALGYAGVEAGEVDLFIPHQANVRIVEAVCQRIGVPMDKTVVNISKYGNTSAASIPLAIGDALAEGRINDGDLVLLSGFGAGMTWASVVLRWGRS